MYETRLNLLGPNQGSLNRELIVDRCSIWIHLNRPISLNQLAFRLVVRYIFLKENKCNSLSVRVLYRSIMHVSLSELKQREEDPGLSVWLSDQEIFFERLRSHDPDAFRCLYKNYAAAVYGMVLKRVADQQAADDILEKIFLQVWTLITSFDETKMKLFIWLSRMATKQIDCYYFMHNEIEIQ